VKVLDGIYAAVPRESGLVQGMAEIQYGNTASGINGSQVSSVGAPTEMLQLATINGWGDLRDYGRVTQVPGAIFGMYPQITEF
jgi:hypothetical protein